MSAIDDRFANLRRENRPALMPYLCAGFPDGATFRSLLQAAADAGADLVEIGIPFSDPIADGPAIQHASNDALIAGTTPAKALEWSRKFDGAVKVVMTYANVVLARGAKRFFAGAAKAGFSGAIVPDLTPEGARLHVEDASGLDLIPMVAPTTTPGRLRKLVAGRGGFVYLVSVAGVTGARKDLPPGLEAFVKRVRRVTPRPVCVGFGIATPAHAAAVGRFADGVIVGSALVNVIRAAGKKRAAGEVRKFLEKMRRALDAARS
ncbi:MAG: tryptophan synthase subunit alpha [Planctomycetes bacterium]|nr:tryptophan synthase subunit alpha [Planctomycetota bacterium]